MNIIKYLILIFKGALVGFGAILPGVSGGTLCVAFGMYQPIIDLLNHPFRTLKKDWLRLMLFIIGGGLGFVGLSGLAGWLMEKNSAAVTCVFIGFILGTIPELWQNAGERGRAKSSYVSIGVGFAALLAVTLTLRYAAGVELEAGFASWLLCGVLWGLSFIVPGLSSSTLIMFFGLYQPMLEGISKLSFGVLIPLAIGMGGSLLLLSRAINAAFEKWYSQLSHGIIGFVAASTLMVLPLDAFETLGSAAISVVCVVCGFAVSYAVGRINAAIMAKAESEA